MIQRCIWILALFSFLACNKPIENNAIPDLFELIVVDSTLIIEKDFFLNGQMEVKLVGDSLIAVSSFKSMAIAFYGMDGTEYGYIAAKDFPEAPFSPSSFDISEFPSLYILEHRRGSILKFDVQSKSYVETIKLNLPEGKAPKMAMSKFMVIPEGYLVELHSNLYSASDPKYYKNSGDLIYLFDKDLNVLNSFLNYPREFENTKGSILPNNYLVSSEFEQTILLSFAHDKELKRFNMKSPGKILEIIGLPKSRYFNYSINEADRIVTMEDRMSGQVTVPRNHYFISIFEDEELIIIQTWMNKDGDKRSREFYSNLFIYNKKMKSWGETRNPREYFSIGNLAGMVKDTLYFYEGNLVNQDEKYIKRAVLRQIQD